MRLKVRVTFKNALGHKTATQEMTPKAIEWYRNNKISSPYKKIVVIK